MNLVRQIVYGFGRTWLSRDKVRWRDTGVFWIMRRVRFAFRAVTLDSLPLVRIDGGKIDQAGVHVKEYGPPAVLR